MDDMLHVISVAMSYDDDILVTGGTQEEHLMYLEAVLRALMERGVRMTRRKCDF